MPKRKPRLAAARRHGQRAIAELRHMTADSALYWVLSHKGRVAQFRRAVKGTAAARSLERLLTMIREEATPLERAPRRKAARVTRRRRRVARRRYAAPPFLVG